MRNYKLGIGTAALVALVGGCISFEECRDKAVNAQKEEMLKYVSEQRFGKTLPKLSESAISAFFLTNLTDKQKDDIRKAVESEFNERRDNYVVQKWISYKNERIRTSVDSLISEATAAAATNGFSAARAAFERAREVAWRESVNAEIDGVRMAKVNDRVHEDAVKLLEETINVAEWPIIEKEMRLIADKAIKAGQPANGIAALRNYPNIRTYTSILDEKVGALVAELSRLNVPKSACDKIVEQTIRFMTQAANLMDTVDESRTTKSRFSYTTAQTTTPRRSSTGWPSTFPNSLPTFPSRHRRKGKSLCPRYSTDLGRLRSTSVSTPFATSSSPTSQK